GLSRRSQLAHDAEHVGVGADAQRDHVAALRELGQRGRRGDAVFAGEGFCLVGAAVRHGDEQPARLQMPGHRPAHGAESDESCLDIGHCITPSDRFRDHAYINMTSFPRKRDPFCSWYARRRSTWIAAFAAMTPEKNAFPYASAP